MILLCKIVFDFDDFILRRKSEYGTVIKEQNPDVGLIALCIHMAVDVDRLLFVEGSAVHKIGITPDYEVPLPEGDNGMYGFADTEHDIQLIKAIEVMKESLK